MIVQSKGIHAIQLKMQTIQLNVYQQHMFNLDPYLAWEAIAI